MIIAFALLAASALITPTPDFLTEFGRTCVTARSLSDLNKLLAKDGWKPTANQTAKIAGVIAAVEPMLETQGLSSDYQTYALDSYDRHLELAVSQTKRPIADGRKLIGCSLYDFSAAVPVDSQQIQAFAGSAAGQKSSMGDVSVEKWSNLHGPGSGMRAVFVPPNSQVKSVLGFTGMMLGTHFLDGATN